ncbi:3-isopropylmalate dehydrogenase [Lysinibacillus sp. G4S2]|uniref:3-isopropylmalate dehydrogenase n=1 Tax=Lysinibacillus sp. G4S2 TaxID=3055859 RepID=UPI0025A2ADE2|nr:3-isopropylmalate dehydrogenase [Lysinibacillus sp. G4S2]MDM5247624.1 3-isopropylmalate dehydrogenase [Lysinibacillus sp. G4S2]
MDFFKIFMFLFIIIANIIGFFVFFKKKSIYLSALTILCLAIVFGGAGSLLAIAIINDPFAIFFGLQIGYILMINGVIVLLIAVLKTVVKKINSVM